MFIYDIFILVGIKYIYHIKIMKTISDEPHPILVKKTLVAFYIQLGVCNFFFFILYIMEGVPALWTGLICTGPGGAR